MTAPPLLLDYAPPVPWYRRRRFRVLAVALAMLLGAFFLARWGWSQRDQWRLLLVQQRCMNYVAPPGTVVFHRPAELDFSGLKRLPESSWPIPAPWWDLRIKLHPRVSTSHGTLFLHRRTSPAGNSRLVAIDLNVSWFPESTVIAANKVVVQPASFASPPKLLWGGRLPGDYTVGDLLGARQSLLYPPYGKGVKCLFGQPDPADASHFTIEVVIDGQTSTIDGWLRDDDTVALKVRGPAATKFSRMPPPKRATR